MNIKLEHLDVKNCLLSPGPVHIKLVHMIPTMYNVEAASIFQNLHQISSIQGLTDFPLAFLCRLKLTTTPWIQKLSGIYMFLF